MLFQLPSADLLEKPKASVDGKELEMYLYGRAIAIREATRYRARRRAKSDFGKEKICCCKSKLPDATTESYETPKLPFPPASKRAEKSETDLS